MPFEKQKKGADRCIYQSEAREGPLYDKRKRPTPQTGDNTVKIQFAETRKNKPQKAV
jgi:hypothetical protein